MGYWQTFAAPVIYAGFEPFFLGFLGSTPTYDKDEAVEAMLIIALLCYLATVIMMLLIQFGSFKGNKMAQMGVCAAAFLAGLFILIGAAIWADKSMEFDYFDSGEPYIMTYNITSSALVLAGGGFLVMDILNSGNEVSNSSEGQNVVSNSKADPNEEVDSGDTDPNDSQEAQV